MRKVKVDKAAPSVKKFVRSLKVGQEGVEVVLDGKTVFKAIPASQMSEAERKALIDRTWEMIRKVRERNRHVPASVIQREIREAVDEVRRRQRE
jgi:hypothetical protein